MKFLAADAKRFAEAVRSMLDKAEAEYREIAAQGRTSLGLPILEKRVVV